MDYNKKRWVVLVVVVLSTLLSVQDTHGVYSLVHGHRN